MTREDVIAYLVEQGYHSYSPSTHGLSAVWAGHKKFNSVYENYPLCDHNGTKIGWHVVLYETNINNYNSRSIEIEIVAELSAIWFDLKAYAISYLDVKEDLPFVEKYLFRAWEAITETDGRNE